MVQATSQGQCIFQTDAMKWPCFFNSRMARLSSVVRFATLFSSSRFA